MGDFGSSGASCVLADLCRAALAPLGARLVFVLLLLAIGPAGLALAQAPAPRPENREQIVVTGTRRPQPLYEIGGTLTQIDSAAIEQSKVRDVLELLRDVPGFAVVQTGSRGGTTSLFARGGGSNHNLVLVDGVQVNQGGGNFDFSNLSTDGLERIEIVRGPLGTLYGSDAVSSVVQLITRRGEGALNGSARAMLGSRKSYEVGATLQGGNEQLAYSLGAGRHSSDGIFSLNNDSENSSLRGRVDYEFTPAFDVKLTGAYADSAFNFPTDSGDAQGQYLPVDPGQGRKTKDWSGGLTARWQLSDFVEQNFFFSNADWFNRYRDRLDPIPTDFSESKTRSRERRSTAEYRLALRAPLGPELETHFTLGLEYERQAFRSRGRRASPGSATVLSHANEKRRNLGGFLQGELALSDRIFVTLGLRADDNSVFGDTTNPVASLAWHWPESSTRFHAAASTGFKEPTFSQNFGFPGSVDGNLGLEPERSRSFEVGVQQGLWDDRVRLALTYYRTDFENLISYVPGSPLGTYENVQAVRSQGLEAEIGWVLSDRWELGATYSFLRTRVRDPGGATESNASFVEGEELLRRPAHTGSFWVAYTDAALELRLSGTIVGARTDRAFPAFPASPFRVRNDAYMKLDLGASYRVYSAADARDTRLVLRLENLLNEDYEEAYGFEAPGFQIFAGVEQTF